MKNILLLILLFSGSCFATDLRIATYNILNENSGNAPGPWDDRKNAVFDIIQLSDSDVFGLQEDTENQVNDVKMHFKSEYKTVIFDRHSNVKSNDQSLSIFYRKSKLRVLDKGHELFLRPSKNNILLSGYPDYSNGERSNRGRGFAWVKFQDTSSSTIFYLYNLHATPKGQDLKSEIQNLPYDDYIKQTEMQYLSEDLWGQEPDIPKIVIGDFNSKPERRSFYYLINNKNAANQGFPNTDPMTYHQDFKKLYCLNDCVDTIDHILTTFDVDRISYDIINSNLANEVGSDHALLVGNVSIDDVIPKYLNWFIPLAREYLNP